MKGNCFLEGARVRESEQDGKQNSNCRPRAPDVVPGIGQKDQHGKRGREREKEKKKELACQGLCLMELAEDRGKKSPAKTYEG